MLVIDLSGSMRVDDLAAADGKRSDRLSAVFEAARRFIDNRPNDRLGLVFFGTTALTSCPLTHDHDTVIQFLERTERQQRSRWSRRGMDDPEAGLLGSATNLGLGLGSALRCLKDTAAKGRAVILITDGADTRQLPNWVDPLEAARRTEGMGVRVYGIGVGNPQGSFTINDAWGNVRLIPLAQVPEFLPDMPRLASIAKLAHGQAFAANDRAGLDQVFREIDRLEPTERTVPTVEDSTDLYWPLLAAGLVAIGLALALEPRLRGVA
jgi:Ca-activated chloride channel family protein